MARQTRAVRERIERLIDFYQAKERNEALVKLVETLEAVVLLLNNPDPIAGLRRYPSNYPVLARYGINWFKCHVYWIGYVDHDGHPTMTNFFYETDGMDQNLLLEVYDVEAM